MTSGDLTFDMTQKILHYFDALSNAAYRLSLGGRGAELEEWGGLNNNPPSGGGKSRGPSGCGLLGQSKLSERTAGSPEWGLCFTAEACRAGSPLPGNHYMPTCAKSCPMDIGLKSPELCRIN